MQEKLGGVVGGPLEIRVWLRLLSCCMMIEKKIRRNFINEFDTTLPRFDVMSALDRAPEGLSMGELSRSLLVSNGNITSIIRHLINEDMVVSRLDPHDRRSAIVALSPKGQKNFKRQAQAHRAWVKEAMEGFDAESQDALYDLLARFKTSVASDER